MTKVIVDYSINRLVDYGKFFFESKFLTVDIDSRYPKEDIHNIAIYLIMEIETVTKNQIKVNGCMTIKIQGEI